MPNIIYTRGAQGSGKTTIARLYAGIKAGERPPCVVLSRDDFRDAIKGVNDWHIDIEIMTRAARFAAANEALTLGWSVIFDQTCHEEHTERSIRNFAADMGIKPIRWDFWTPLGTCRGRNARRDNPVPDEVVIRYYDMIQARRASEPDSLYLTGYIIDTNNPGRKPYVPDYLLRD